ncbi:alpha/beta hydrolase [Fodinicola feengrottensis]|uniref:alpha/beta hydrolase n=1 Tax=Fodinicola feengrottensis TaxID=435914 RepID=UPI0031D4237B
MGTWRFLETETASIEGSFDAFAAWCGRTTGCALHGDDVGKVVDDLYARAEKGDLPDPFDPGQKYSPTDLLQDVQGTLYDASSFGFEAEELADLRDGKPLPQAVGRTRAAVNWGTLVRNPFQAVFCEDWPMSVSGFGELDLYRRALEQIAPHMHRSILAWSSVTGCLGAAIAVQNPQHRLTVRGSAPILMVNSVHDPATPYAWAVDVHQQIPNSVLLTYDGSGHGTYLHPCVMAAVDTYLTTLATPRPGTHCPRIDPPATG